MGAGPRAKESAPASGRVAGRAIGPLRSRGVKVKGSQFLAYEQHEPIAPFTRGNECSTRPLLYRVTLVDLKP